MGGEPNIELVSSIRENIPGLYAIMVIDNEGNLLEHFADESFAKQYSFSELKYVAKLVSLRYNIVEFNKIFDGLSMTINIFREISMVVTSRDGKIVCVMVRKQNDLHETMDLLNLVLEQPQQ